MPKLNACYSKKLPTTAQYSNETFSASVEVEIDEADPQTMQTGLRRLFALVRESVEQQFRAGAAHPKPATTPPSSAPRPAPRNFQAASNGRHVPATASQKKAVYAICKSLGLDPAQYDIDALGIKQASALIDELKRQQAGV